MTGAALGVWTNTTDNITSTEGGTGTSASQNITVGNAPTIAISFDRSSLPLTWTTSLNFTVSNSAGNPALSGLAFTDTLPAGLSVADGTASACGGAPRSPKR